MERVAIVGARGASLETLEKVRAYVRALPRGTIVVSGGAAGADWVAADAAVRRGLHVVEYTAHAGANDSHVKCDGKRVVELSSESMRDVLIFRNTLIAIRCTRMVAFVQGSKGGTWDAIRQAERFKRPVEVR